MEDLEEKSEDFRKGYHKGCLETLQKEREELVRIVTIVEQLMQMHGKNLEELGVELETEDIEEENVNQNDKKPIEDLL